MSRFVPQLKYAWLVTKRNRCPRDIRKKLTELVRKHIFIWETEQLRWERISTYSVMVIDPEDELPWLPSPIETTIRENVERFTGRTEDYRQLTLQMVMLKNGRLYYALQPHWRWLGD